MSGFTISQVLVNQTLNIVLEGSIGITSQFPALELAGVEKIIFNTEKVKYINSGGIRNWLVWMRPINEDFPGIKLIFRNLTSVIFNQNLSIEGFIPNRSKIESIYIPFFCEHCGAEATKLFEAAAYFKKSDPKVTILSSIRAMKCPQCSEPMEVAVLDEKYFSCLALYRGD